MPILTLRLRKAEHFAEPGPPHWSAWDHDEAIVNHYAPQIQTALQKSLKGVQAAVRAAVASWGSLPIAKADTSANQGERAMAHQVSAQAVESNVSIDRDTLTAIVAQIYGDGYLIGTHAAANILGGGAVSFLSALDQAVDWDTWTPGNPEAALQAADGGLARLLASAGVTVKGISDTTLDQLGNKIAQGLEAGESTQAIYLDVRGFVDNPVRATMIARTETARAVVASAFETYEEAGVAQWAWMVAPGACPICEHNAINGPYPLGGGPYMPAHPQCRCAPQGLPA